MEEKANSIETLFERVVAYGNTSITLLKLQTLDKSSDVVSTLVPRLCILIVTAMFILILSIGTALWLSDLLGKSYEGFFIVAGFYLIVALVLFSVRKWIKKRIGNLVVTEALN